jgi:hypothetical protein
MSDTEILPSPVISNKPPAEGKFAQERHAFRRLLPSLVESYSDTFVAIHESEVIDSDIDDALLASRVYKKIGYIPIYVGYVGEERVLRVPSPRMPRGGSED